MTRYTVVWDQFVERQFILAWVNGNSITRSVLTEVANWLDHTLKLDPETKGKSAAETNTQTIDVPISTLTASITATYQLFHADRQVRIVRIVFRLAS